MLCYDNNILLSLSCNWLHYWILNMNVTLWLLQQITDDIDWAEEAFISLKVQCAMELQFNIELWILIFGTDTYQPNPELMGFLCPSECQNNGTCAEGIHSLLMQGKDLFYFRAIVEDNYNAFASVLPQQRIVVCALRISTCSIVQLTPKLWPLIYVKLICSQNCWSNFNIFFTNLGKKFSTNWITSQIGL